MNDKKSFLKIFMLLALIQAAVGAYLIFDYISLSKEGKEFKFKCSVNTWYRDGNFLNVQIKEGSKCDYSEKLAVVEKRRKKTGSSICEYLYRADSIPVQFGDGKDGYAKIEAYGNKAQKPSVFYMKPSFYTQKDKNDKPLEKPFITFSWQNLRYPLKDSDFEELRDYLAKINKEKFDEFKAAETKRLGREAIVNEHETPPYCDVYIKIKNGKAMLSKLVIDGVPAEDIAKKFPPK